MKKSAFITAALSLLLIVSSGCASIDTVFGPVDTPTVVATPSRTAMSSQEALVMEVELTETPQPYRHAIARTPLNMRRCENYKCSIVTQIPNATTILVRSCRVLDDFSSWCEVYYDNEVGFVNADYLRPALSFNK